MCQVILLFSALNLSNYSTFDTNGGRLQIKVEGCDLPYSVYDLEYKVANR